MKSRAKIVRQLRNGQITIPKEFREALNLESDDLLEVRLAEGRLEIAPVKTTSKGPGSPWLLELYELFAPAREALKDLSEDEINAEIDAALREVRRKRKNA